MVSDFLSNIIDLILFVWALQTFCLQRQPVAMAKIQEGVG